MTACQYATLVIICHGDKVTRRPGSHEGYQDLAATRGTRTWQPRGVPGPGSHERYQDLAATRGTRTWQPRGLPLHFLTWMEHDKKCRPGSHEGCHYISSHGWSMIRNVDLAATRAATTFPHMDGA